MKITDEQYELVAAYIKDELKGEVLTDFEATLVKNEALLEEVAFQKSILSALRLNVTADTLQQATVDNLLEDKTLHPQIEVIQNNIQQARIDNINRQRRIRRWLMGLAIAACVVLVSTVGLKKYLNGQLDRDMANVAATVERERAPLTKGVKDVSARRSIIEHKLNRAEAAFKKGDWAATTYVFDTLRNQYKYNSVEMNFCEGIIFYNKKEYGKSIKKLESIDLEEAKLFCEIRHFLALSYLKTKNKPKAKEQYKILSENSQKCNKQAIKQLKKYFIL